MRSRRPPTPTLTLGPTRETKNGVRTIVAALAKTSDVRAAFRSMERGHFEQFLRDRVRESPKLPGRRGVEQAIQDEVARFVAQLVDARAKHQRLQGQLNNAQHDGADPWAVPKRPDAADEPEP